MLGTQEIDAADVLEVTDLANAIARAEEVIRARSSRVLMSGPDSSPRLEDRGEDIFDKLVAPKQAAESPVAEKAVATDDAVGPAVHVPYRPTPLPPRTSPIPLPPGIARPATLLRAPEEVFATPIPVAVSTPPSATPATLLPAVSAAAPVAPAPVSANATQPLAAVTIPPAARTAPILILDEDAFYHPAGRIRTLADVTIDGYRPEPTLMVRLRERRHALKWVVTAIVAVLALFAIFAVAVGFGRASAEHPAPAATTKPAPTTAPLATMTPAPVARPITTPAATAAEMPVFDVNSLKNAPPAKRR